MLLTSSCWLYCYFFFYHILLWKNYFHNPLISLVLCSKELHVHDRSISPQPVLPQTFYFDSSLNWLGFMTVNKFFKEDPCVHILWVPSCVRIFISGLHSGTYLGWVKLSWVTLSLEILDDTSLYSGIEYRLVKIEGNLIDSPYFLCQYAKRLFLFKPLKFSMLKGYVSVFSICFPGSWCALSMWRFIFFVCQSNLLVSYLCIFTLSYLWVL